MRLLIPLLISLALGACSSNNTTDFSVASQYQPNTSAYALGLNAYKKHRYTPPRSAQVEFDRCVGFVLRDMQVGEQCKWEVPGNSIGIVKLVQVDANGCHYMFNTMLYKGKQKQWQEIACYSYNTKKWKFQ
jgi:hypothetical protein